MRKLMLLLVCMCLAVVQLYAQNRTVTGKVTDEKGAGLAGATVSASNTIRTVTNEAGIFTISVPANINSLEISYIGYLLQRVSIGANNTVSVSLRPSEINTDSLVVTTGVGRAVQKARFGGSSASISQKDITNRPVGSFDQLIQGRVPGVLGITGSGQPGNASTIIIRGQNSIAGGVQPLYIIDGIPVEAGVFQSINPNDFASFEVLKDGASAAIYGSRGSAGVIVVTTKRGQSGKLKLAYSGQMGVKARPEITYDMMSASELLKTQEQYGLIVNPTMDAATRTNIPGYFYSANNPNNASLSPAQKAANQAILDSLGGINTDWRDQIFRKGTFSNHQISLSGGTGRTRIYSSVAFYNEEGTTTRTDMSRVTLRNNFDYGDEKLTFQVSSILGYTKRNFQQSTTTNSTGNPFLIANIATPYAAVKDPTKDTFYVGIGNKFTGANQLDLTRYDKNYNDQVKATIGLTASYKITSDISAGITSGIDFRETQGTAYGSKLAFLRRSSTSITGNQGNITESLTRFFRGNVRPSVSYRKKIEKHDIDFSIYGEYIREFTKSFSALGYITDAKRPNTIAAVVPGNTNQLFQSISGGRGQNSLLSGFAIGRYTFDNKYTIGASFRRDGSSKLPEDNRWQNFWSVDGVWDMKKENFLSSASFVNTLRLRASYGGAGNADNFPFGDGGYQSTYDGGTYAGLNTIVASNPGNPEQKWETTYTLNLGVDFGLLKNNRIYGSVDVYDRRTKDLFVENRLSSQAGFGNDYAIFLNAGELQNKGIEAILNYDLIKNNSTTLTLFGNFGYNKNEVLDLGTVESFVQGTTLVKKGLPLGSHYEVKWAGVDAATGAPLYYDLAGNITTAYSTANAVQEFGTWESPWKGGFGARLDVKGFDVSTLFSFQAGGRKVNNLEYFVENPVGFLAGGYNQATTLDFWKQPGDVTSTPSPLFSSNFSSKIIHGASFMRLRDLTVGYTLPSNVLRRTKAISSARFYVQGTNLFMLTNWRGMDPEAGNVNINLSEFPNPRAFTVGLDVQF